MDSIIQMLQSEMLELRSIIKKQSEKITYTETVMAELITRSGIGSNSNEEDEDDEDDDEDEDEEDDEEDDKEENKKIFINTHYESRLDYLEEFVSHLEKKILELEKRQRTTTL